jgi:ribose transport system substrate-binding protein
MRLELPGTVRDLAIVLAAALAMTACTKTPSKTIGVVPKGSTHIFWRTVNAGALKAASETGYQILWNAPAQEGDRSRQIAIVESMINQRVAGIALAPCDRSALSGVVDRAADAGIPVMIFDSGIDTTRRLGYVGTDNRQGGRVAARRLGEALSGKGLVAIITDTPGSASTTERDEGFTQEMKEKFPGIRLLDIQFCEASRAKARAITENLLSAHADLAGIFADHENANSGAVLALKARAKGAVKLVGFDASEPLVDDLREGWIDSLVIQNPFRMGYDSVKGIAAKLGGAAAPADVDTGVTLVRSGDLSRADIRELLFPDIEKYFRGK